MIGNMPGSKNSYEGLTSRELMHDALHAVPDVAVLDRADSPGGAPPLFAEVAAATHDARTRLRSVVYGLGGRDLHPDGIERIFESLRDRALPDVVYAGLRGAL